jgi:hypothetical protein
VIPVESLMVERQHNNDPKLLKKRIFNVSQFTPEQHKGALDRSLRQGALGLLDTVVMAVAGSAPAYSITASTAALAAAVGIAGPAALFQQEKGLAELCLSVKPSFLRTTPAKKPRTECCCPPVSGRYFPISVSAWCAK